MYHAILVLHSFNRWFVFALAITATIRSIRGGRYGQSDNRVSTLLTISVDVQLLLGLLLYFVYSPITHAALAGFRGAMKNPSLRYWAVEHAFTMIAVWVLVHVGRVSVRRASSGTQKHRRSLAFFGLSTILLIAAMPWPFLRNGRPLFSAF